MLKHMVEGKVLDVVVGGVDMRVGVLKGGLDDESRGITGLGGRSMVGAGIATLGLNPGNVAVLKMLAKGHGLVQGYTNLLNDGLDKCSQTRVDKVGDNTNTLGLASIKGLLDIASHVLLKHSLDIAAALLV